MAAPGRSTGHAPGACRGPRATAGQSGEAGCPRPAPHPAPPALLCSTRATMLSLALQGPFQALRRGFQGWAGAGGAGCGKGGRARLPFAYGRSQAAAASLAPCPRVPWGPLGSPAPECCLPLRPTEASSSSSFSRCCSGALCITFPLLKLLNVDSVFLVRPFKLFLGGHRFYAN